MAISPLGGSFPNFPGSTTGLEKLGIPKEALFAASAAVGLASGLKGDPVGNFVRAVVGSIEKDPKGAAELARQFTQLGAAVIRAGANEQEANAAHAQPFVEETTTTKRVEVGEGGKRTVKTTTTTTTERTSDPKAEAARARLEAQQIEQLGSGLVDGKIQVGGETITFGQVKNLFDAILQFEKNGRKEEFKEVEIAPVDINEGGVVGSSENVKDKDIFSDIFANAGIDSPKESASQTASVAPDSPKENVSSTDLDTVAGLAKTILNGEQLSQLKQLASALDDNQLAALIRKVVS